MAIPWHTQPVEDVLRHWSSSEAGLAAAEAAARLKTHGPNELTERRGKGPLAMLREQFTETMVLILIAAGIISAFLGKGTETAAILAIVVLFAVLGFVQEFRAERAMAALKQLAVPVVRVRRGGKLLRDVRPRARAGRHRPAGGGQRGSRGCPPDGERQPPDPGGGADRRVRGGRKTVAAIPETALPVGDRRNMAYLGTSVTYGRGSAVVVATGMKTELGKIAGLIQDVAPEKTPLQRRLDRIGKALAAAGGIAAVLVLLVGWWSGEPLADMFLTAVSVAVAVVPEGLPAVVTITLALGAQRMLRRNALIRKLPAVETLGAVTVICSDKTGTLTENRMTVTVVDAAGERLNLMENLRRRAPTVTADECRISADWDLPLPIRLALAPGPCATTPCSSPMPARAASTPSATRPRARCWWRRPAAGCSRTACRQKRRVSPKCRLIRTASG